MTAARDAEGAVAKETGGLPRLSQLSQLWRALGPGLITGASDDDPSGIATYAQTGAQFAYAPTWSLVFSYPLMTAIQIISARLGRTTGRGVAGNLCRHYPSFLAYGAVALLAIANTINIGADIGAMADSVRVMIGGPQVLYVLLFGAGCVIAEIYVPYDRYVRILKWITLSLFAYVATLFFAKVDWPALLGSMVIPHFSLNADYLTAIVAIFGTTISPYLFFWQASEEVDNLQASPRRRPLKTAPRQAERARRRINFDTMAGMAFSNIIGLSIMATAAATLHDKHIGDLSSSAQVAETLRPVAGVLAEFIFALGIVGAGLLAVPVLAGSAAYAVGETLHRPTGLNRKLNQA
ncbi:MAG TPA: divalent metal cation transporter, partial [Roseiarcus sp.]|nr:divalent metal cation transporter [Roseiarcus sp.]